MSKEVGLAIVGTGFMAATHLDAYQQIGLADVRYVVGRAAGSADTAAARVGAHATTRFADALEDPAVDVVDLTVPTPLHRDFAVAAFQAGKHVIVEKPLALDLASADLIIEAAQEAGKALLVAHVLRFWEAYEQVVEVVSSGRLGIPLLARTYRLASPPAWASWLADPQQTGGAAVDLGIHDLDILCQLFGPPGSVDAWGRRSANGASSHYVARLDFGSVTATAEASMTMPTGFPFTAGIWVHCDHGTVKHHFQAGGASFEEGGAQSSTVIYPVGEAPQELPSQSADPFVSQLNHFLSCVAQGQESCRITPAAARLALATSLAVNASLESGEPVTLSS